MRKLLVLIAVVAVLIVAGCSKADEKPATPTAEAEDTQADVVTTASIVNTNSAFHTATSAEGTWIIAVLEDMSFSEEILIEGEFTRNDKIYRKLAFYTQDENRTVTDRYTVTAPRMIVRSPNTRIQGGTFKGDVYVEANGFHLVDGTVDGDIYFASQEFSDSFSADEPSTVSGETVVQK